VGVPVQPHPIKEEAMTKITRGALGLTSLVLVAVTGCGSDPPTSAVLAHRCDDGRVLVVNRDGWWYEDVNGFDLTPPQPGKMPDEC
jgi:hypothetical protein